MSYYIISLYYRDKHTHKDSINSREYNEENIDEIHEIDINYDAIDYEFNCSPSTAKENVNTDINSGDEENVSKIYNKLIV